MVNVEAGIHHPANILFRGDPVDRINLRRVQKDCLIILRTGRRCVWPVFRSAHKFAELQTRAAHPPKCGNQYSVPSEYAGKAFIHSPNLSVYDELAEEVRT